MTPKLVHCLFASMLVGGMCAGGVAVAGGGILLTLLAYSASGSASLVPIAFWAFQEPREVAPRSPSLLAPRLLPTLH